MVAEVKGKDPTPGATVRLCPFYPGSRPLWRIKTMILYARFVLISFGRPILLDVGTLFVLSVSSSVLTQVPGVQSVILIWKIGQVL